MAALSAASKGLRAIAKGMKGAKGAGPRGLAAMKTGTLSAAIGSALGSMYQGGQDDSVDKSQSASGTRGKYAPITKGRHILSPRDIRPQHLFDSLDIIGRNYEIVPELGPEQGQYAKHLNLIIKRVAKLEGRVAKQNALIDKLRRAIGDQTEQDRRKHLEDKRAADEADSEKPRPRAKANRQLQKVRDVASDTGSMLARLGKVIGGGALMIGGSYALGSTDVEASTLVQAADQIDGIEEAAIKAFRGTHGIMRAGLGTAAVNKFAGQLKASDALQTVRSVSGGGLGSFGPATQSIGTAGSVSKVKNQVRNLRIVNKWLQSIAAKSSQIGNAAKEWIKALPQRIQNLIGKGAKKLVKWYLVFQAIMAMIRAGRRYLLGDISAADFHQGNKDQINTILSLLGPPWALSIIAGAIGGSIGPLGGAVGAVGGVIVGLLWGDEVYKAIGVDRIVSAMYDFFVHQRTDGFKQIWADVNSWVQAQVTYLIGETAVDAKNYVLGVDVASSEQTIEAKYGDVSTADLISKASEGIGTDENAILAAAKRIKTQEQYDRVSEQFEQQHGKPLRDHLYKELSRDEFNHVEAIIETNIRREAQRQSGMAVAETTAPAQTETVMKRRYKNKKGAELIHDILGHGIWNVAGDKRDLVAALEGVTWDEYRQIESDYEENTGRSLPVDISNFVGTQEFDNIVNMITVATRNENKQKQSSITQTRGIGSKANLIGYHATQGDDGSIKYVPVYRGDDQQITHTRALIPIDDNQVGSAEFKDIVSQIEVAPSALQQPVSIIPVSMPQSPRRPTSSNMTSSRRTDSTAPPRSTRDNYLTAKSRT